MKTYNCFEKFLILRDLSRLAKNSAIDPIVVDTENLSRQSYICVSPSTNVTVSKYTISHGYGKPTKTFTTYWLKIDNNSTAKNMPKKLQASGLMAHIAYKIINQQATK